MGSRNAKTPSRVSFNFTPRASAAFSTLVKDSSSIISPFSSSPFTCWRFIKIPRNALPNASPSACVTTPIVVIAAVNSSTSTPEDAACEPAILVASASLDIVIALRFVT